ncbi:hypothetical protein AB0N17_27125 [Streptomyces sp. NPDC051133]|uniref:hypothetical protein n=1 Tax=Streptomyces sp. NPDC051133 TaxID=3155521 RepID=UPI0034208968
MDGERGACPVCGQPVEAAVRRHKTLGVWVPVRGAGPCRNPECRAFAQPARRRPDERRAETDRTRDRPGAEPGDGTAGTP